MIVQRFDSALYVRTAWFKGSLDKVVRLKIGTGPVDFVQERLIPAGTAPGATISAFYKSTSFIRSGSDESPAARFDGAYLGGNHTAPTHYQYWMWLDGEPLSALRGYWTGTTLEISESYGIPTLAAINLHVAEPVRATVAINRKFSVDGFCRFGYTLTALRDISFEFITGMQLLKPIVSGNQTVWLYVPKSNLKAGIDITGDNTRRLLPPSDWDNASDPPDYFRFEVRAGNVPQYGIAMGFNTGQARGTLSTAIEISQYGKAYPRGYEAGTTLAPGMSRSVSGYFGSYNLLGS